MVRRQPQKKYLFIEGSELYENRALQEAFSAFLKKKLNLNMPRIKMCGGKTQAVDIFLNHQMPSDKDFLLVDLDAAEHTREDDLKKNNLKKHEAAVFYMIHEMEAWFLSQKKLLADYYDDQTLLSKLTGKNPADVPHPDEELVRVTLKNKKRGSYHKINHGADLLEKLDIDQLMKDFPDVNRLITALSA